MALIELCLLSLLSPQSADATPTPSAPTTAQAPEHAGQSAPDGGQDPRRQLEALEQGEQPADPDQLLALTSCADADVAARAAWLLAQRHDDAGHERLLQVIDGPVAEARLQAVRELCRVDAKDAFTIALHELQDPDRRVRTVAAQTLGALRRPAAAEPLVGMIEEAAGEACSEPTDVQAALLALADIGTGHGLLRVATAIQDGKVTGTGNWLAFTLQTLSPKLEDGEVTLLCGVLAHRDAPVRRYAITRLAELGDKRAISALEGRLGKEEQQLRPLVELALNQLRRDVAPAPTDDMDRAMANAEVLWLRAKSWWNGLQPLHQGIAAGVPGVLLVLLVLWRRAAARRARAAEAAAAAAWVQPSDDYLEEQESAQYEDDGEYYDEATGEADAFEQEGYDDEQYDDGQQYDTSGWQEDGEQQPTGQQVEDELFR
ncbi:MAG: HEAT repeat domain-containing protein [Planctomycetota bacterium]